MRQKLKSTGYLILDTRYSSCSGTLRRDETSIKHRASSIENRGFTLTEVIMASALLIIALVPILKALTIGHITTVIIQQRSLGLMLAQAKLDEIKARSIYNYTAGSFAQSHLSLDGKYLCNIDDTTVSSNLRKITISVGYDRNNNNQLGNDEVEVTLATYFARRW